MSQLTKIIFTFKYPFYNDVEQYDNVQSEDKLEVIYFCKCWSLTAAIERLLVSSGVSFKNGKCFLTKDSIEKIYFQIAEELAFARAGTIKTIYADCKSEEYIDNLKKNLCNLEWLLFFIEGRIAASQFFEQISKDCFYSTKERDKYLEMCEAWGNAKADSFEIIFSIEEAEK